MKYILSIIVLLFIGMVGWTQEEPNRSLSVGYFGEFISHPGIKASMHFPLKSWVKIKGEDRLIQKQLEIAPSIGMYHHRRYQTGFMILPEIGLKRTNAKHRHFTYGTGLGFLHTVVYNSYAVLESGEVAPIGSTHQYALTSAFISYGRSFEMEKTKVGYYLKPQLAAAIPHYPNMVGYFFLELGLTLQKSSDAQE